MKSIYIFESTVLIVDNVLRNGEDITTKGQIEILIKERIYLLTLDWFMTVFLFSLSLSLSLSRFLGFLCLSVFLFFPKVFSLLNE